MYWHYIQLRARQTVLFLLNYLKLTRHTLICASSILFAHINSVKKLAHKLVDGTMDTLHHLGPSLSCCKCWTRVIKKFVNATWSGSSMILLHGSPQWGQNVQ
jgi:hypothetical protein